MKDNRVDKLIEVTRKAIFSIKSGEDNSKVLETFFNELEDIKQENSFYAIATTKDIYKSQTLTK